MSDTNDMRRDFETWLPLSYESACEEIAWRSWKVATERAAQVVEAMTERRRMNSSQKPDCEYAAAIRQGCAG